MLGNKIEPFKNLSVSLISPCSNFHKFYTVLKIKQKLLLLM